MDLKMSGSSWGRGRVGRPSLISQNESQLDNGLESKGHRWRCWPGEWRPLQLVKSFRAKSTFRQSKEPPQLPIHNESEEMAAFEDSPEMCLKVFPACTLHNSPRDHLHQCDVRHGLWRAQEQPRLRCDIHRQRPRRGVQRRGGDEAQQPEEEVQPVKAPRELAKVLDHWGHV